VGNPIKRQGIGGRFNAANAMFCAVPFSHPKSHLLKTQNTFFMTPAEKFLREQIPTMVEERHVSGMKLETMISLLQGYFQNETHRLKEAELKKIESHCCPHCRSADIQMFDSDNDMCKTCGRYFPAVISHKHTRTGIA
jgi:hypothetical protein